MQRKVETNARSVFIPVSDISREDDVLDEYEVRVCPMDGVKARNGVGDWQVSLRLPPIQATPPEMFPFLPTCSMIAVCFKCEANASFYSVLCMARFYTFNLHTPLDFDRSCTRCDVEEI